MPPSAPVNALPVATAVIDPETVASLVRATVDTLLTVSPLALVIVLTYFLGGLLWRLRLIDRADPLARRKDARLYHSTLAFTLPALAGIQADQKAGLRDHGLTAQDISGMINRITDTLPPAAGHRLRLGLAGQAWLTEAVDEIQRMLRIKQSPARSTVPDLEKSLLESWLQASADDTRSVPVLARALHEAYLSGITFGIDVAPQKGAGSLTVDPRVFDPHFNVSGARRLQDALARTGIDGEPNSAALTFLGFLGSPDVPPAALGAVPVRLTFLDLHPVVDYLLDRERDAELLEELTHHALVEFYQRARMARSVHDLPDALIRPSEGEDAGGMIARQMAVIRGLRAQIAMDQQPLFLLLQEAVHQLEIVVNPVQTSMYHLLDQAARLGEENRAATERNLLRLQDAGRALLIPLICMAERRVVFQQDPDDYWREFEPATERDGFLRQFNVKGRDHADAFIRARILMQQYDCLRALAPAYPGERPACTSFDTLAGDARQLRIGAAIVIAMIDQCGLRGNRPMAAAREVLAEAMTRQGYSRRGNLSDLVRVSLKERDALGNTVMLRRARPVSETESPAEIWVKRNPAE